MSNVPKRILFVDDESALLDGLRGRLRGLRSRWEMVFVESASRAITEIEHRPFDVVVSDMRMPAMDGALLLSTIAERWPATIRIVLSGHVQEEQCARVLTSAHQFLSKPCTAPQLENVIDRCMNLHELLTEPRLRNVVGRVKKLPTIPSAFARLRDLMSNPEVSFNQIATAVSADAAIAAKVLQMVNSSFLRLGRRISRIDQAVNYLGLVAIRNLVLSAEVFSGWRMHPELPDLAPERLQARAQQVAGAAWALTQGTAIADDAMVAGLLHKIGYWVLVQECPTEMARAVEMARVQSIPLPMAERELIGASHAEVGAYLLGLWGLPHAVVEAVAFQHSPAQVAHAEFDALTALVIAQSLTSSDCLSVGGALERDPHNDQEFVSSVVLPFDWQEARRRVAESGESA
ncbi:MAG: response regulator [Steroidobacter sp.]